MQIAYVNIFVADIDQAVAFRRDTLGLGLHTGVGLDVADLAAEHSRLAGLGVQFTMPPTRQPWGGVMAMIADADGNIFYLGQVSGAR